MAFPATWPPQPATGRRSLRFYIGGTATANYSDRAYIFADQVGANTNTPTPVVQPGTHDTVSFPPGPYGSEAWASVIHVYNDGAADLYISFDGTHDHGVVKPNTDTFYWGRYEQGIAVKGSSAFRIEAW